MIRRVSGLVIRYAFPFCVFTALLTYPLWLYRNAYPGAWPAVVQSAGGSPVAMDGILRVEAGLIGFAIKLIAAVAAFAFLPAIAISRLARTAHPWPDALAIGIPGFLYGAFVVVTIGCWVGIGTGLIGAGLFGFEFAYAGILGAVLVLMARGARSVSTVGELIRLPLTGECLFEPRVYRRLVVLAVFPLVAAYVTAIWWVPLAWDGALLSGRPMAEAFAVVGAIESLCLVLATITWGAAWHVGYATTQELDTEAVVEAFA